MSDKPDSNNSPEEENSRTSVVLGDQIVSNGDLRNGVVVGRGTINTHQIAGDGATFNSSNQASVQELETKFAEKLEHLQQLITEARKAGELDPSLAEDALVSLQDTVKLLQHDKRPAKGKVIGKLEYVGDILDTAVDLLGAGGGIATILGRTLPVTSLLVKIASRIF